ncbi:MAG: hypothetical protein U1E65_10865 [Myxococcota bacterium]
MMILASLRSVLAVSGLFVFGVMKSTALIGGWHLLRQRFEPFGPAPEPKQYLGYFSLRYLIGINGGGIISSDRRGLAIATWPVLLSWAYPEIFIPWAEVERVEAVPPRLFGFGRYYRVWIKRAPELDLRLRDRSFEFVRKNAEAAGVVITGA